MLSVLVSVEDWQVSENFVAWAGTIFHSIGKKGLSAFFPFKILLGGLIRWKSLSLFSFFLGFGMKEIQRRRCFHKWLDLKCFWSFSNLKENILKNHLILECLFVEPLHPFETTVKILSAKKMLLLPIFHQSRSNSLGENKREEKKKLFAQY